MKYYKEYLKYVLEHKKNVFKICWKKKMYLHAFTHDLSKFGLTEFKAYAEWFHGEYGISLGRCPVETHLHYVEHSMAKTRFDFAWQHHKDKNKHHWNYWSERDLEMPVKYIKQMICDWEAMGIKFGDTAVEFYLSNYDKIKLNHRSRLSLEWELGLLDSALLVSSMTIKDAGFLEEDKIKYGIK